MAQLQLIAIVLLALALTYVLYLYWKRKDMIECPSCGAHVNLYSDECPHCGHEKEPVTGDDETEDDAEAVDEGDRYDKEIVDEDEMQDEDDASDEQDDSELDEPDEEAAFRCEECGKEFDSEHGLKTHAGQKHKE